MISTAQPGRVKTLIKVPFHRPRDVMALQSTPEFGSLVHQIWASLREEVDRARGRSEIAEEGP
jgi:NitT/TauT family transport system ATP-binding protein